MSRCEKCSHRFTGDKCPRCGGSPVLTRSQANDAVRTYIWAMFAGLLGALLVTYRYPLVDLDPPLILCLVVFFTPVVIHIVLVWRKVLSARFALLRSAYKWSGAAALVLALFLFLNGALDRSPTTEVRSVVTRKSASHGRGGPTYYLTVSPSWRPSRSNERLRVTGTTFGSVQTGDPVTIDLHAGACGLPWFSRVSRQ